MPELTLDDIDLDDTETLCALGDLWLRAYNSTRPPAPLMGAEAAALVLGCAQDSLWRLAGRYEGRPVSMAFGVQVRESDGAGAPIPGQLLIRLVAVDTAFHNRGFGRTTVSRLLYLARERGFAEAQLWADLLNAPARQLYDRLGFRMSGRTMLDRGEFISQLTVCLSA